MPEDYQAILADLGVDTSAPQDTQPTTTDTQANNQTVDLGSTDGSADTADNAAENTTNASAPQDDNQEADRRNAAFAAMRSENTKYKNFIQHMMKGANFQGDEAAFIEAMSDASYKRQAQAQGGQVSPEVLKRMDTLESQNRTLLDAQNRQMFTQNLKNMQEALNLKEADLKEFVDLAVREHIDLTIPGTNFITLYQGLFYEKLKTRDIEAARQTWIEQNSKANNAATLDGKSGKKDPTSTNVNTMAEFDSLLQSIPNSKK